MEILGILVICVGPYLLVAAVATIASNVVSAVFGRR